MFETCFVELFLFALNLVTIQLNAWERRQTTHCNYSVAPICEKKACGVYWFVHEQADDEAEGVLLNSY
jgi:hypothetical protein